MAIPATSLEPDIKIAGQIRPRIFSEDSESTEDSHDRPKNLAKRKIELDYSELLEHGELKYKPFAGLEIGGIRVTRHEYVSETTLKIQRGYKIVAALGTIGLNLIAFAGLFISGAKLTFNSLFNRGNEDRIYHSLGNAYLASSISGTLTGLAHESWEWSFGNFFMGIFSRLGLDKLQNFAGFLSADGIASIGMGRVRFREKGNTLLVPFSIFNNTNLSFLEFLKPIEQGVYSFARRFVSPSGWKTFIRNEPYELFNTAGGGLFGAGAILGLVSVFKNKISEKLQQFAYLPAGLFSLVNLIAFWRDGDVLIDRAKMMGGKKPAETYTQHIEGNSKRIAAPFLAINNFLLGCKGLGIDPNGIMYHLAMGMRAFGAAFAFLSFTAQSFMKFLKPESFGPMKNKEIIEMEFDHLIGVDTLKELIEDLEIPETRTRLEIKNELYEEFLNIIASDKHGRFLMNLMEVDDFKDLFDRRQAGLPVYGNDKTYARYYIDRGTHSVSTCAIAIDLVRTLRRIYIGNPKLTNFIDEFELPIKVAALKHDLRHGPYSHVLDKALPGNDNDLRTLERIRDPRSMVHQAIVRESAKEGVDGEEVISKILYLLGRWGPPLISGWGPDRIEDRKSTRLNSSHSAKSRMPSSA